MTLSDVLRRMLWIQHWVSAVCLASAPLSCFLLSKVFHLFELETTHFETIGESLKQVSYDPYIELIG